MPVLLEVNVAGEASKFGYPPEKLLAELKELNALPRIEIHGLMTMPPLRDRAGKGASAFPAAAGIEGARRGGARRSAAAIEHGHERRFRGGD